MYKFCIQGLSVVGEGIDTDCIMFHFIVNTFPFLFGLKCEWQICWAINSDSRSIWIADNILQVSILSLKCLVIFLDHLGKIQLFHL